MFHRRCACAFLLAAIVALPLSAGESDEEDDKPTAADEWAPIIARHQELRTRWNDAERTTKSAEENRAARAAIPDPFLSVLPDVVAFEERWRGTDEALAALGWIAGYGSSTVDAKDPVSLAWDKAVEILLRHYLSHPHLDFVLYECESPFSASSEKLLRAARRHRDADVRAAATYVLARQMKQSSNLAASYAALATLKRKSSLPGRTDPQDLVDQLAGIGYTRANAPDKQKEAIGMLNELVANHGSARIRRWVVHCDTYLFWFEDTSTAPQMPTFAEKAEPLLFELQHLQLGCQAPELETNDVAGVPMRLSSYRGKVVVLSFLSGNIEGGKDRSAALYPDFHQLIQAHDPQKFSVLCVMSETKAETARRDVRTGEVSWPVWLDGDKSPIATRWCVPYWPTMLVLDRQGVIRFRLVGDAEYLASAVETVLQDGAVGSGR